MDNVFTIYKSNIHYSLVGSGETDSDDVILDAAQDVQDWLMHEFDPAVWWEYTPASVAGHHFVPWGKERVTVRADVYTALVLRWS